MSSDKILLGHGSGGKLSHILIEDVFVPYFKNDTLERMEDAAVLPFNGDELVFTTDSYVVDPVFFPGGDIGKIAVCGTVNDLSVMGAIPKYLSVGFILEEGLAISDLKKILSSMKAAAVEANVSIVTGDTKVVPHGAADKIFINTSGVGTLERKGVALGGDRARPGDTIIINGPIADHGVAVMAHREGLELDAEVKSDAAPLNLLIDKMLEVIPQINVLRDPTRGGIATTLNEIARHSQVGIKLIESEIPVSNQVRSVCEILGLDPFYLANEGKCIAICPNAQSDRLIAVMREHKYGRGACKIGEVVKKPAGKVYMETSIGGQRLLDMLSGEQFPRIC
jgi:hydrogenase expression/formation protein HypE